MELPDFASELWIMTASGLPLIHHSRIVDKKGELFAGLVSAITTFAEDIFTEQCKSIKMNTSKLTFLHNYDPDLIFLCRSEAKTLERRIMTFLCHVREIFLEEYGEMLITWVGSMKYFKNFALV